MPIQRQSLRDGVREEVLRRLADGELEHGANINEVQLAAELGVSRTPLREALIALENEGITESSAGRGFRWARVSEQELRDIVPILATMEALAMELTPASEWPALASTLLAEAEAFPADAEQHAVIMRRDDEWHAMLLSRCPNERLLELIATLRTTLRRYERLLVPDERSLERAASEHREIARRLEAGDVPAAMAALKANWDHGLARLIEASRVSGLPRSG
jgi:DNA-binding GntR family transcriptional regulator